MTMTTKQLMQAALLCVAFHTLLPSAAMAQERIPFLAEGKSWVFIHYSQRPGEEDVPRDTTTYSVLSDTIVQGIPCKLLETEYGTVTAFEKGRDVWYFPAQSEEPRIMYVFDCNVGDSITIGSPEPHRAEVTRVDSASILNGAHYRTITYTTDDGLTSSYTECLGSGLGIINNPYIAGVNVRMFITIGGQPVTNSIKDTKQGQAELAETANRIYNLQGVRLAQPPKQGIYIRNGKKHTAK